MSQGNGKLMCGNHEARLTNIEKWEGWLVGILIGVGLLVLDRIFNYLPHISSIARASGG